MKALKETSFVVLVLLCLSVSRGGAEAEGFLFSRDLTVGSRGDDVSALQQSLIVGGFLKIPAPTAYFGPLTRDAVAAWQASAGISPSAGYFGPISRGKMNTVTTVTTVTTTTTTATAPAASSAATPVTPAKDGSPVRLKIAKLSVDAGFQYTGLTSAGVMEIPTNITDIGWYTGSVRPGEKGVAVVTGHVAQIRGGIMTKPGVFYHLDELSIGDTIEVTNDKGVSTAFVVRAVRSFDPAADATEVFFSKDGGTHMNIITCEGTWDATKQSYTQRLVVFTDAR